MAYIYCITNNINQKKYIGKTSNTNPQVRWKQHLQAARYRENSIAYSSIHTMPICRAIKKHGEINFKFEVLEECAEESVNEREEHFIKEYNTADGAGYNCTYGGEGVKKPKKYWSNHPHSKAVSCYTLDGEWVRDYETRGLAAADVGNGNRASTINYCIKGTTFQAFGYRWAWKGEPLKEVNNRINRRGKVYGIHPESGRKKMWNSAADCAEELAKNRKRNLSVSNSLSSPTSNKLQAYGWYLFFSKNDANSNWTKATRVRSKEHYQHAAELSAQKRRRPVCGVSITTGEEVRFDSISEASFFIKGDKNYKAVQNIIKNAQGKSKYAYGYKWNYE